nr:hypothetical protein [Candidatus Sigynarchaeota archaeon]
KIIAIDRSYVKIARLAERASMMGMSCIKAIATKTDFLMKHLPAFEPGAILIDPPCSALGLRMKFYTSITRKDILDFQANQLRIWKHVEPNIASGTRIVYCTCTITREENEDVIASVSDKYGLDILDARAGVPSLDGQPAIAPGLQTDTLAPAESKKVLRFYPHVSGTIGFFIALLRKM